AGHIRDDLLALESATEADMLNVQLDDRALFLTRWRKLLIDTLVLPTGTAAAGDPRRAELRDLVAAWDGRAGVDAVGYRAVLDFHHRAAWLALDPLLARCRKASPAFRPYDLTQQEGPVWQLVSARPVHLLDPKYKTWDDLLVA